MQRQTRVLRINPALRRTSEPASGFAIDRYTETRSLRVLTFLILLTMGDCVTVSTTAHAPSPLTDSDLNNSWAGTPATPAAPAQPERIEKALGSDACSIRLGDIEGALVLYYAVNRQLPLQLDNLRTDNGSPLPLSCPTSGRPYLYSAQGLASPGRLMRIIVWDDAPVHNGFRWCIFMAPTRTGQLSLDVRPIPESMFKTYALPAQ
jgi:hypothetical protein